MRIDSYMTPEEAQKWWRENGREVRGSGGAYVHDFLPRYNTPQERYRQKKKITLAKLEKKIRCRNIYAFEQGKLEKVTDMGWIRLAAFYGIMVKSLEIMTTTQWWGKYLEAYAKHEGETEHRRIRLAATEVMNLYQDKIESNKKKAELKVPYKPKVWYKQGSLCRGGIY